MSILKNVPSCVNSVIVDSPMGKGPFDRPQDAGRDRHQVKMMLSERDRLGYDTNSNMRSDAKDSTLKAAFD